MIYLEFRNYLLNYKTVDRPSILHQKLCNETMKLSLQTFTVMAVPQISWRQNKY